jgi:hypothetical protein
MPCGCASAHRECSRQAAHHLDLTRYKRGQPSLAAAIETVRFTDGTEMSLPTEVQAPIANAGAMYVDSFIRGF